MSRAGRASPTRLARRPFIGRPTAVARLVETVLLAVLAGAVAALATQCSSAPSLPDAVNGRYIGFSVPGFPPSTADLTSLTRRTGIEPNLVSLYTAVGSPFHASAVSQITRRGALPLIQIDPVRSPLQEIAAGLRDSWLRRYARAVRQSGRPVAIGFAHEFNGPWFDWSYTHVPASVFIRAWRRLVTVFRRAGATNVIWVWTIIVSGPGTSPLAAYWPGNAFVDWVGVDGYFYTPSSTFDGVFGPTLAQVRRFTADPVLITETGAAPKSDRAARIYNLFAGAASTPGVIGLIWFDYNKAGGHEWRIDGDPSALAAFHRAATSYWSG